jgi:hypothetical protein
MDRTVYTAWKHPHLPYELLPGLCDYDRAAHLRDMAFKRLIVPRGQKRLHLAFRMIRLFRESFVSGFVSVPVVVFVLLREFMVMLMCGHGG